MHENSSSGLDVESLMHEIRETVAREQRRAAENRLGSVPMSNGGNTDALGALRLQPEFQLKHDNQYHVNDLLKFHNEEFVRNAYRALLLREPDESGLWRHLEGLASGRFNKIDVLASLHSSPEGRASRVRIAGLSISAAIRRLGRVPIIGYFIRLLIAVARFPLLLRHQRQFEFYLTSQQQRIVDHQNQGYKEFRDALAQISAQILDGIQKSKEQQQAIHSSLRQHEERYRELAAQQTESGKFIAASFAEARAYVDEWTIKVTQQIASQTKDQLQQQQTLIRQQQEDRQELARKQEQLGSQIEEQLQQLMLRQEQAHEQLSAQKRVLVEQDRRLTVLLEEVRQNAPSISKPSFTQLAGNEEDHLLDALYASFEDQFRGKRDEVRQRLEVYVPILRDAGITEGVLDVGCGRGEWLELLKSERIQARGIDRNRILVADCQTAGLDVVEADALLHLRSLREESLHAVTSFHLVEHLQFEALIKLLDEAVRILRSGGLLILETPNPENFMVGSYNFYADPTHRNPIPSQTLRFLLEARGLRSVAVLKLRPWDEAKIDGDSEIIKRFNEYFYGAPDYGIIARKP